MNAWWEEDLERLRREQNPGRYEQPSLRLPIPTSHPREEVFRQSDAEADPQHGVCIIDM